MSKARAERISWIFLFGLHCVLLILVIKISSVSAVEDDWFGGKILLSSTFVWWFQLCLLWAGFVAQVAAIHWQLQSSWHLASHNVLDLQFLCLTYLLSPASQKNIMWVHCNMAIYCCCCLISRVFGCWQIHGVTKIDYNLPEHFESGHQDCFATNYSIQNSNGENQGGWITNNVFSAPLLQVLSLRSSWWTTIFFLFLCSHSTVWLNLAVCCHYFGLLLSSI